MDFRIGQGVLQLKDRFTNGINRPVPAPIGFILVAALQIIGGGLLLLAGVLVGGPGRLLVIGIGLILIVAGIGYFRLFKWSWEAGIASHISVIGWLVGLTVVDNTLPETRSIIILVSLGFIFYLTRSNVMQYLRQLDPMEKR